MIKTILKHSIYYCSIPGWVYLLFWLFNRLLNLTDAPLDLGTLVIATYGFLLCGFPCLIALLMRFSMLPWPVDPFAAAEIPLTFCAVLLIGRVRRTGALSGAWTWLEEQLADDGGFLAFVLIVMFLYGLLCSLSFRRMKGDHLPGRIWRFVRRKNTEAEE